VTRTAQAPTRRQESARQTRLLILRAARDLFVARGYGATTIAVIAERAGVAVPTVYAVFTNKPTILGEVLDLSIAGDDAEVAINERDWMRDVWKAPTAQERLAAYAAGLTRILDGAADVFMVVSTAATTDPDLADLAATTLERRRAGATAVIDSVRKVGRLRPGLTRARAIDVLWTLNSPEVFQLLVRRSGWPLKRYQSWVADALVRELLAD
jgi:AcrR family transcriptional regulator